MHLIYMINISSQLLLTCSKKIKKWFRQRTAINNCEKQTITKKSLVIKLSLHISNSESYET